MYDVKRGTRTLFSAGKTQEICLEYYVKYFSKDKIYQTPSSVPFVQKEDKIDRMLVRVKHVVNDVMKTRGKNSSLLQAKMRS